MMEQRRATKIMPAAGPGACSFLHAPEGISGCALSNQEIEIDVKRRLGSKIYANLPDTCVCKHANRGPPDGGMNGTVTIPQLTK